MHLSLIKVAHKVHLSYFQVRLSYFQVQLVAAEVPGQHLEQMQRRSKYKEFPDDIQKCQRGYE